MKKLISILLVLVMVMAFLPVQVMAADPYQVVAVDKTAIKVGDTVHLTLTLPDIEGAGNFTIVLNFDTDLLTATDAGDPDNLLGQKNTTKTDPVSITSNLTDYEEDISEALAKVNEAGAVTANASYTKDALLISGVKVIDVTFTAKATGTATFSFETFTIKSASATLLDTSGLAQLPTVTISEAAPAECAHTSRTAHPAVAPTCIAAGNSAYWECDSCHKYFDAATGGNEITENSWVLPATGKHTAAGTWSSDDDYHWHTCTTSDCTEQLDKAAHSWGVVKETGTANNSNTGHQLQCSVCHKIKTTEETHAAADATAWEHNDTQHWNVCGCGVKVNVADHSGGTATCKDQAVCEVCHASYGSVNANNHVGKTTHNQEDPTCAKYGCKAYYECTACNKYYSDSGYTTQITDLDAWKNTSGDNGGQIAKVAHTIDATTNKIAGKASTCTVAGWKDYYQCSVCKGYFEDAAGSTPISDFGAWKADTGALALAAHSFTVLKYDATHHWYKCANCDATDGKTAHSGGTATCQAKAVCTVCSQAYGNLADHNYGTLIPKVDATCTTAGTKAHYECSVCHNLFDESKTATTAEALVIPALNHSWNDTYNYNDTNHWKVCTRSDCDETTTPERHDLEWIVDTAATLYAPGVQHQACKVCGYTCSENTPIEQLTHTHTGITHHAAVPATCTAAGTVEYWTCSDEYCSDKYYGDNACQTLLETIVDPIDSTNHTGKTTHNQVNATCTEFGCKAYYECTACHKYYSDADYTTEITNLTEWQNGEGQIAKANHAYTVLKYDETQHWYKCANCDATTTPENHTGGTATCQAKAVCTVCSQAYGDLAAHSYGTLISEVAATCTTAGKAAHYECSACHNLFDESKVATTETALVIAALGHDLVKTDAKAATCEEPGNNAYWTCQRDGCGKVFANEAGTQETTVVAQTIAALGHAWATEWSSDGTNHWHVCTRTGCTATSDTAVHSIVTDPAVAATCQMTGLTEGSHCSICGKVLVAQTVVPLTTHNYGADGRCTVCRTMNPVQNITADDVDELIEAAKNGDGLVLAEVGDMSETEVIELIKDAATNGTLTTKNEVTEMSEDAVRTEDKAAIADEISTNIEGKEVTIGGETVEVENVEVKQYLDLSVVLVASGTDVGNLTATDEPVTFSVSLDEDLVAELEGKVVFVLRIHGDDVTLLPATLDENGVLTFTTDKFSTYAIVTADPVEDPGHDGPTPPYRPWPWWTPTTPSHGGSGSGTTTTTTSGKSFTTNLNGITAVYVDGKKIDSKYYTVNGKVITLTDEFLKTLPDGKHTLKAESATGVATATFSTSNGTALKSAATGDAGMALYAAMGVMSLMGMGWVGKKRHN